MQLSIPSGYGTKLMEFMAGGRVKNRPKEQRVERDNYPTPFCAVEPLMRVEKFEGVVWEPACGDGYIVRALARFGIEALATDIDHGVDFLEVDAQVDCIVTNPPYKLADKFLLHSSRCSRKSALLLRLSFLESQKRQDLFKRIPLYKVYIMTNRLPFWTPDGWCKSGGQFCHAWFILDHDRYDGETRLGWLVPSGGIEP
jgi:hypothetical protein